MMKNLLAVVFGLVVGSAVNMTIVTVGPVVIPSPAGVDLSQTDRLAENLKSLEPIHFLAPWLAHALGTLAGTFVAANRAASHQMTFALGIAAFFLLGGVMTVTMVGGPLWFVLADLILAYLPMGFLGGKLAGVRKWDKTTSP